ncbi:MAG: hypothetical protein BWZ01_02367 [Deltaproteobacteria bacterium ADurb.BinA179]|nr:MAG: hypothetical protein BWZ01_02367 [Deltaproteobacteria bacterium ADurb.BinA179]
MPSIVVPPGEATISLRSPGCLPVSSTMAAAPFSVAAASSIARFLGSPARTPPSAMASTKRKQNAGPDPDRAVTAFISLSSTCIHLPTEENISRAVLTSSSVHEGEAQRADAPSRTRAGVLGMTLTTRDCPPMTAWMDSMDTPAAILITSLLDASSFTRLRTAATLSGLTARISTRLF